MLSNRPLFSETGLESKPMNPLLRLFNQARDASLRENLIGSKEYPDSEGINRIERASSFRSESDLNTIAELLRKTGYSGIWDHSTANTQTHDSRFDGRYYPAFHTASVGSSVDASTPIHEMFHSLQYNDPMASVLGKQRSDINYTYVPIIGHGYYTQPTEMQARGLTTELLDRLDPSITRLGNAEPTPFTQETKNSFSRLLDILAGKNQGEGTGFPVRSNLFLR
jgi:hypothetical protein